MAIETDARRIETLELLASQGDAPALRALLETLGLRESARLLSRLDDEDQERILTTLPSDFAAELLQGLNDTQAAQFLEKLDAEDAAPILNEMYSDDTADVLAQLDDDFAEAVINAMEPEAAEDARLLGKYAPDTAGGLMLTEYLAYGEHATVADVVRDMRENSDKYSHYSVQYSYVVDDAGRLVGVLALRDLLLTIGNRQIASLMIKNPVSVNDLMHLDALDLFFEDRPYIAVPVVDASQKLVGVVRRNDVEEALGDRAQRSFLRQQGIVSGEELRSMPVLLRARRRLSWLSINILLNMFAAGVIAFYQETLASVIALAVFLPIISDMSGCSGSQAVAVSMRELTLGLLKPTELVRVWIKEASVGIFNGVALGSLVAMLAYVWKGNPHLGLVVGGALALNTVIAVVIGGSIPLILKRLKADPALAAGPILTTITDMGGFFLVLSFANAMLPYLT
jgi:magnesium transporter